MNLNSQYLCELRKNSKNFFFRFRPSALYFHLAVLGNKGFHDGPGNQVGDAAEAEHDEIAGGLTFESEETEGRSGEADQNRRSPGAVKPDSEGQNSPAQEEEVNAGCRATFALNLAS